jgi:hypothetical protein
MTMSTQELRAENKDLGWAELPTGCPERTVSRICEYRARVLAGIETRAASPQVNAEVIKLRDRLAEQRI